MPRNRKVARRKLPGRGPLQSWTPEKVLRHIQSLRRQGQSLAPGDMAKHHSRLYLAAFHHWKTYRNAVTNAGIPYDTVLKGPRKWPRQAVLTELRRLHCQGRDLSHNALKRRDTSLYAGACRQFGTYRRAVEAAGISYVSVARELQRSWTKQQVIAAIRRRHRRGRNLAHNYIKKHESKLFSAMHRHFKTYRSAIAAAGVDYEQVAEVAQQKWDKQRVIRELRTLAKGGGKLTRSRMGMKLYGAVWRHFGSIPKALKAARLPADLAHEAVEPWSKRQTLTELRKLADSGRRVIRANMSFRLYRNILRHFGNMARAVEAAGYDYEQVAKFPHEHWSRQRVLDELRAMVNIRRRIVSSNLDRKLTSAVRRYLGGITRARQALGLV